PQVESRAAKQDERQRNHRQHGGAHVEYGVLVAETSPLAFEEGGPVPSIGVAEIEHQVHGPSRWTTNGCTGFAKSRCKRLRTCSATSRSVRLGGTVNGTYLTCGRAVWPGDGSIAAVKPPSRRSPD